MEPELWLVTTLMVLNSFQLDLESMSRYASPVNPAIYPHLALVLLCIGLFFTAWFFVYEVTSTKFTREIVKEVLVLLFSSANKELPP